MDKETLVSDDRLTEQQPLSHWLALLHAPGIGPITLARLLEHYHSPTAILAAADSGELQPSRQLKKASLAWLSRPDWSAIDRDLEWQATAPEHHIVTLENPDYPPLLREIADPPALLFVKGDTALLKRPQLAIVGSRNPTPIGLDTSYAFARSLAATGLTITSGLALGVDAAAHQGALDAKGHTIAVTGTGLDRVYPARHRDLAHRIATQGALVSEFPPGTPPKADHFPRRNRIISGMSIGTLVTEAALRSGSLITARQALEQGREVFAIPGSIHNPLARGCHSLIRNGAKLVEEICDIIEELGHFQPGPILAGIAGHSDNNPNGAPGQNPITATKLDPQQEKVINSLGFEPTTLDTLIIRTGLTADVLATILLTLELTGIVATLAGGHYMRRQP